MRTSPAGRANNAVGAVRGVTLIELLVVVTIMAVLALGVGLSAGGLFAPRGGVSTADQLTQADLRARDAAVLGRARIGIYPRRDGWIMARRDDEGRWQPEGAPLRVADARLTWQVDGRRYLPGPSEPGTREAPPVQFAPDGGSTGFSLRVEQGRDRLDCDAEAGRRLECGLR